MINTDISMIQLFQPKISQGTSGKTKSQTPFLGIPFLSEEHPSRHFNSECNAVYFPVLHFEQLNFSNCVVL